ncbi:glycosyltransferase family 2 protein [Streptomyces mobaraensis]|uniref:glycosyltransferase family 2 protein n=1 Tax=Streptomyces mobaraensis TaxID=35621 RepID=UPI00332C8929
MPAHNEAQRVRSTILSLQQQTTPPKTITVVLDACTDDTEAVAVAAGARTMATINNRDKKSGALNQALDQVLPMLADNDKVLVVDADSVLAPLWIETALQVMSADSSVGAVGGIFYGEERPGMLFQLQRNEYARYARDVSRRGRGAWVLTGTSTLFRVSVLREIAASRGGLLPGDPDAYYHRQAVTEDMEIILACLRLGYKCVSPWRCATTTELMPTWGELWKQRLRWNHGALENIRCYGIDRTAVPYLVQQVWSLLCLTLAIAYPSLLLASTAEGISFHVNPFLCGVVVLSLVERLVTVRRVGAKGVLLALALVPESCYGLFMLAVYCAGWRRFLLKRETGWHHVEHENGRSIPSVQ